MKNVIFKEIEFQKCLSPANIVVAAYQKQLYNGLHPSTFFTVLLVRKFQQNRTEAMTLTFRIK